VRISADSGWSESVGPFYEEVWEGSENFIRGLAVDAQQSATEYRFGNRGPLWQITIRWAKEQDGGEETPQTELRLSGNRLARSMYEHPNYGAVSLENLARVRQWFLDPDPENLLGLDDLDNDGRAVELFELLLEGIDTFPVDQPVLVVGDIASTRFDFNNFRNYYEDVGAIFTTAFLTAEYDADLRVALPDESDPPTGRIFGWRKGFPEYTRTGLQKAMISQEWEYGLWDVRVYGGAVQ
jgi:hypothetical protein